LALLDVLKERDREIKTIVEKKEKK
jgi:hypothetical protein